VVFVVALAGRVVLRIRTTVDVVAFRNLSTLLAGICAVELRVLALFLAPRFLCLRHAPSSPYDIPSYSREEASSEVATGASTSGRADVRGR
jgi:hypothetical protein